MDFAVSQPLLAGWLFVLVRLLGWAAADPFLGRLPWSLRLLLAGALAGAWAPGLPAAPVEPFTAAGLILLAQSFLVGAMLGFAVRLLVAVAQTALSLAGLTASLGLTQVTAEQKGGLDAVLEALAWWLALFAFFSANGHLLLVQAVHTSFAAVPATALPAAADARALAEAGGLLLAAALQLGLPLLVLVLLAQFAFLILSRTLPGVDGFSLGLTLGMLALLGGLVLAVPLLVSGLGGFMLRVLPQLVH